MFDRYDQDLLLDYLEGELDEDRRAELDAMLAEDPQLAALLNEMRSDRATLRSLPHEVAPAELVNDVTKTLERRMLLDDPVEDIGPIPMSRGRAATVEPTRSISWGRVVGLTGLAASVALVAGILVITFDDPLQHTANELAANTPAEEAEADVVAESAIAEDRESVEDAIDGIAARGNSNGILGTPETEGLAAAEPDANTAQGDSLPDEAVARVDDTPDWAGTPSAPELDRPADRAVTAPAETVTVGTIAAFSAIQPRQQLVLLSESPEVSLEQLFEFCLANGIAVVQPEQLALNQDNAKEVARDTQLNDTPGEAGDEVVGSDYALLINESQLDSLVMTLNNEVTIDPKRAGKASLISNQAALVADLSKDDLRYGAYLQDVVEQEGGKNDEPAPGVTKQIEQQAIQLRNPDLGSPYNNTRNRYNLQQQANYGQRETPPSDLKDSFDSVADTSEAKLAVEQTPPYAGASDLDEDLALKEQESPAALVQNNPKAATADLANLDRRNSARQIDPTRGNWLSAHLPVADTAPLLLQWRDSPAKEQTKLVPVMVQRAAPDKVNTLRQRQQVEYANRSKAGEATREAETDPAAEAENAEAEPARPTDSKPADAEPAKPTE
jgi:hypothetical protein